MLVVIYVVGGPRLMRKSAGVSQGGLCMFEMRLSRSTLQSRFREIAASAGSRILSATRVCNIYQLCIHSGMKLL